MKAKSVLWLLGGFLLLGGIVFVTVTVVATKSLEAINPKVDLEASYAKAKEAGLLLSAEDFAVHPRVPDSDDAGVVLRKVDIVLEKAGGELQDEGDDALDQQGRFDLEKGRDYLKKYPQLEELAKEAATKPRCDLKLDWSHPDETGYSGETSALFNAGRTLVIQALVDGADGKTSSAVANLQQSEKLTEPTLEQVGCLYYAASYWIHYMEDKAIQQLADMWAQDTLKLSQIEALLNNDRKTFPIRRSFLTLIYRDVTYYRAYSDSAVQKSDLPKPLKEFGRGIIKQSTGQLIAQELDWGAWVVNRASSEKSEASWEKAIFDGEAKWKSDSAKASNLNFLKPRPCPYPGGMLIGIKVDRDRRQLLRAYLTVLQWKVKHNALPKSLAEAGVTHAEGLQYEQREDGFDLSALSRIKSIDASSDAKQLNMQKVQDREVFRFRPRAQG